MMKSAHSNGLEIAVIGMALRLPCATSPKEFFDRLCRGEELIRPIDDEGLLHNGVSAQEIANPNYVKAAGYLDGRFEFDADFFDYRPREAEFMDPQLRFLHECCWEALEAAGCDPQVDSSAIGLYAGSSQNMHWLRAVSRHVGDNIGEIYDLKMLYQREFFNTRIAYRLNLKGPAIGIETTCSTSLVAIHMAAQALLSGDCDIALAGGACVSPILKGYTYHEGMIQSPDGHCRPFDAEAKGTVPGQGVGIVALKRLGDAIADGNQIHAVLKSSAINNDGNDKVGYTAPSVSGQSRVVSTAMELAEIDATGIDFVECHGTATRIGDPIEIEALGQAYGDIKRDDACLLGSVKSNIGHLDTAAGVIGFIKAVMALEHGVLPPSLHFRTPNPMMDLGGSKFKINAELTKMHREDRPLRGGVSSFGIGGTNAHIIVEEYIERRAQTSDLGVHRLFPLSAKTPDALRAFAAKLAMAVELPTFAIDALALTLQRKRRHYRCRDYVVADSHASLRAKLEDVAASQCESARASGDIVFMFSGQGAQYPGMTRILYERDLVYRGFVEECLEHLPTLDAQVLRTLLTGSSSLERDKEVSRTDVTQPLLFVVEYALAKTLMKRGIQPTAMVGHSLGEYVAASLAGVFALGDALALVRERGRLMAKAESGAMLGVRLSEADVRPYLRDGLELAAINSTSLVVVAGDMDAIAGFESRLAEQGIHCVRLKTSHAYHSRMMEPALPEFRMRVAATPRHAPNMTYFSNVTGAPVQPIQATDPDYWCRHLRESVRFADAIDALLKHGPRTFVEIGPGNALSTFVSQHAAFTPDNLCLQSIRHAQQVEDDDAVLLRLIGLLYAAGIDPDWSAFDEVTVGPYVAVPTYPFAATRYDQISAQARDGSSSTMRPAEEPRATALAKILHPRPKLSTPFIDATTDLQCRLAKLWGEIFKLDRIGIEDNFFELGGHSLLATRMLADIRDSFGAEVSLNGLFERPNINGLALLVEAAAATGLRYPELLHADRSRPIPASFQQRRLWMIDRLGGGSAQYNMPSPFILNGYLDLDALQAALDGLVQRHESLRTVFREIDDEPVQIVREDATVAIRKVDLSRLTPEMRDQRQRELVSDDALKPFDLAADLPVRVTLAVLGERRHLLLFNVHHIVSDGWSEVLLVKEFGELYRAISAGREPSLQPLPMQYADFAAWQRGWLVGDVLGVELAFWRERLAGIPPVHTLPLDRPRPLAPSHVGAMIRRKIGPALLQRVRDLAQSQNATLFMTLQCAFALLLARWSNSEDLVMGTPIAGRQHKALEPLIGFFVNTLLLRTDLTGNPSFTRLLARTREMALTAFEHQHVPFEMLVDELVPSRSRNHAPLFQILFALQNYERGSFSLDGLELERVEETVSARFDLTLITAESPDGLFADWHYDIDLFDRETIERMAEHYELLLTSVVENPECPFLALPMISADEAHILLHQWQHLLPRPSALDRIDILFEACSARDPSAIAVIFGEETVDYGQLNARANRMAHKLAAMGVAMGDLVAICLPVGPDMIAAMLAVLKAGAGYVPMDPKYPDERLMHMLSDSAPAAMIIDMHACRDIPAACPMIDLSQADERDVLAAYSAENPARKDPYEGLDAPAYVIYTSGSTGAPKGVVITQRQMLASQRSRESLYSPPKASLLLNSISFDSSVPTIYATLLAGGRLCLCDDVQRRDAGAIAELIDKLKISHMLSLPSVYAAVLEFVDGETLTGRSLECVILAAEMFTLAVKERHFSHPTIRAALFNEYGPTECSVWSTCYRCDPTIEEATVPIGRSPGHARLYVLNRVGQLTPIGVEGELHIGGDGVGEGYLRRPDLTSERFLPDPFLSEAGARMYRSGDRVRWRRDGQLEILGRIDNQVKLRGYRIELGEIDAVLESHSLIQRAVSRVLDDRLLSYVEPGEDDEDGLDISELRAFLASRLPDFMIPQRVMPLKRIPLLPNGKVDLDRLPAPAELPQDAGGLQPRTKMEQRIQAVWRDALKIEAPAVDTDFFSLGGDSILLLRLSSSLNRMGLKFPVKAFYLEPTIECMARLVVDTGNRSQDEGPSRGAQGLHPIQRWFLGAEETDRHHFNQSVLLRVTPDFAFDRLLPVVEALYARHDVLRLRFFADERGEWRAEYRPETEVSPAECLCHVEIEPDGTSLESAIEREAGRIQCSLSLTGPLIKFACIRLLDGEARLLIVAHHLIVDGVSWRVLLQDVETAYGQSAAGHQVVLAAKPASFQRAVQALEALAWTSAVRQEMDYWKSILRVPIHALRSRLGTNLIADEAHENLLLSSVLTERILTTCHRAYGMTVDETLLAALRAAFRDWRDMRALGIWMEAHGRTTLQESLDIGETVGWFTAAYPISFGACPDDPAELLRDTKDRMRKMPAKGNHYGLLRYLSDADLDLDDTDFRADAVTFNYLGQFDQVVNSGSSFAVAGEKQGRNISERRRRDAVLAFDGLVSGGNLRFSVKYNRHHFAANDMHGLVAAFGEAITRLAECWTVRDLRGLTPGDLSLLEVSADELADWRRQWPAIVDAYPSTGSQQAMLVQSLRDAGQGSYVNQLVFELHGDVDEVRLHRAWQNLPVVHGVFRTAFTPVRSGGLAQLLLAAEAVRMPLTMHDLRGRSEAAQDAEILSAIAADRLVGFDLAVAPLSRVRIWRVANDRHRLLWTTHHAIIDGWSLPLALRSLLDSYIGVDAAHDSGKCDFKRYMQWLSEQDVVAAEQYWERQLSAIDAPCLLPGSGSGSQLSQPAALTCSIDSATVAELDAFARSTGVTLYTLVQCGWAYLLHLYTGNDQVCFGSVVSGRPADLDGADAVVGLFINTLPVVANVDHAMPLNTWVRQFHQNHLERQQYGHLSLNSILSRLPFGQRAAVFNSVVVYENYPVDRIREEGNAGWPLRIVDLRSEESTGAGLTLVVMPGEGLGLRLMYQSGEFPASQIARILDRFAAILKSMPALAEAPTGMLDDAINSIEVGNAAARSMRVPQLESADVPMMPDLSDDELLSLLDVLEAETKNHQE